MQLYRNGIYVNKIDRKPVKVLNESGIRNMVIVETVDGMQKPTNRKNLGVGFYHFEEANMKTKTIQIKGLSKRDEIDDILVKYDHDIVGDNVVMPVDAAKKFLDELEEKGISI